MDALAEREQALDFLAAVDDAAVERVEPFPCGRLLVDPSFPRMWDANHVRLQTRWTGEPWELAIESKRRARAVGLGHCMVTTADDSDAVRLSPAMRGEGFRPERHVVMAYRRGLDGDPPANVEDVHIEATRAVRESLLRESPFGDDDTVEQVLAYQRKVHERLADTWMAAFDDAVVAASCRRIVRDGLGQIEDVGTIPGRRRRGFASDLVRGGVHRLRADGLGACLIVADDGSHAAALYRRLGFEDIATITRFRLFPLT